MHQSVSDAFVAFSSPLEGVVKSMYLDVKGLVTCGIGCLIDPVELATGAPWVMPDGTPAPVPIIASQWHELKSQPRFSKLHWKFAAAVTTVRLTDDGVLALCRSRLLQNEAILRTYFPNWDAFPADAQLCCFSMAWACGAGFPHTFGNFRAAANAQNWQTAGLCCAIQTENNPGIVPRNAQNRLCCANAAESVRQGLDAETLFWPGATPGARDAHLTLAADAAMLSDGRARVLAEGLMGGLDLTHTDDGTSD